MKSLAAVLVFVAVSSCAPPTSPRMAPGPGALEQRCTDRLGNETAQPLNDGTEVRPTATWIGVGSKAGGTVARLITDERGWKDFWRTHSDGPRPDVDFATSMVIAYVRHIESNHTFEEVQVRDVAGTLRLVAMAFHRGADVDDAHLIHAIVAVPRSEKPVEILFGHYTWAPPCGYYEPAVAPTR